MCRNSLSEAIEPAPLGRADFEEAFDDFAAGGDQVKVAVDRVVRAELAVGRREERHIVPGDLHRLEFRVRILGERIVALAVEVAAEQEIVVRLKDDAEGRTVAEIVVEPDERHVFDHLRPHHAGHFRFADRQLRLHPIARLAADAPQRDHVAEIVLPMAEEIAVPKVIREAAEPLVETLGRHMGGERLDLDVGGHRLLRAAATSAAAASARRPAAPRRIGPAPDRARSRAWYASFAVSWATHEPPIRSRPNSASPGSGISRPSRRAQLAMR